MPYCFLKLTFQVWKTIDNLPHFHGGLWSALLRFGYNRFLKKNENFHETGVLVSPADTGVVSYRQLDKIEVGVALPESEIPRFEKVLENLSAPAGFHGHFVPGKTIRFLHGRCRVSGRAWPDNPPKPLTTEHLEASVQTLASHFEFQLVFDAPLRLTRPPRQKEQQHRYCDEAFFRQHPNHCHHLLRQIFLAQGVEVDARALDWVEAGVCHGMWLDVGYGGDKGKTLGGLVGVLPIKGKLEPPLLEALVWCQWLGVGKNRAFGFGQYHIPQLEKDSPLQPLTKQAHLLKAAMHIDVLSECLQEFSNPNPGPDGLTIEELRSIGTSGLKKLSKTVLNGQYEPETVERFQLEKQGGGERSIYVWSLKDRLLQRAVAQQLNKIIDRWLSQSSFAYRAGLSRQSAKRSYQKAYQSGYRYGIKADIQAFFDSVNRERLQALCWGLFAREPAITLIFQWIGQGAEPQGLPQGSPLSPVLSNLFLEQFDRVLALYDLKLIRFADDFMVLFKSEKDRQSALTLIEQELEQLGLRLEPSKTQHFQPNDAIEFLGYQLTQGEAIAKPSSQKLDVIEQKPEESEPWKPLLTPDWDRGQVIYVTSQMKKITSQGNDLVIENYQNEKEKIPWKKVRQIAVVGKQRMSGGVFYRCLQEEIPITFQRLSGTSYGQLIPERSFYTKHIAPVQWQQFQEPDVCLQWAKSLIRAKIHNQGVVMKRQLNQLPEYTHPSMRKVESCQSMETLRGIEGQAAQLYFKDFGKFVAPFRFARRVYHPPDGPVNAMLSFGYTLLYHRVNSALMRAGLDTRSGFFHQGRGRHAALASDMMEELRYIVDRVVLSLIHLKMIKKEHFMATESRGPRNRLFGEGYKIFVKRFEATMQRTFYSEASQEYITRNTYLDEMADQVCAALRLGLVYTPKLITG